MSRKNGKPCKKCGTNEWYDNGKCRQCTREYTAQWQRDNPKRHGKSVQKWRQANLEKERERTQEWAKNNPERVAENNRRWQRENPERVVQKTLKWKRANLDKDAANSSRYRTRKTGAGGSYTPAEFKALCRQYDNRCLCCGKKAKLTADHVIPVIKGGSSDISNIQPLCGSCNSSKGDKTIDYRTKPGILRWIQERLF